MQDEWRVGEWRDGVRELLGNRVEEVRVEAVQRARRERERREGGDRNEAAEGKPKPPAAAAE